jgi:hypothetical protein
MKHSILLLLFLWGTHSVSAQFSERYLVLDKPSISRNHRIRFNIGDNILLKIKGYRGTENVTITNLTDTSIMMGMREISLGEVKGVVVKRKGPLRTMGAVTLPLAGAMFFLIDVANHSYKNESIFNTWGFRNGGTIAGVGLVLAFTQKRTYRLTWYRTLHVLKTF